MPTERQARRDEFEVARAARRAQGSSRLRPGFFMTAEAWLDEDEYHIWCAHDCATSRVETMLPYPKWRAVDGLVEPSVSCEACGLHTFLRLWEVAHV